MKYAMLFCALLLLTLPAAPVLGQDDTMKLSSAGQGLAQRPPVVFSHARHSELYECTTCHHQYDEYFNNTGGDGGKCADCHQVSPTAKNPTPLTQAFHQQCKRCHATLLELKAPKTGPIMCGQCHVRGVKTAAKK